MACDECSDKSRGKKGDPGVSSITYIAYASAADGTGFSLIPSDSLPYISMVVKESPVVSLTLADFPVPFIRYIGERGEFGGDSDLFKFNATPAIGDPGSGFVGADNANFSGVAQVIISRFDYPNGVDMIIWLSFMAASSNPLKGFLRLAKELDSTEFAVYGITGVTAQPTYVQVQVTYLGSTSNSPFTQDDILVVSYATSGNKGNPGVNARATLFNDLSQPSLAETSGSYQSLLLKNIPALTFVDDGDSVELEILVKCASNPDPTLFSCSKVFLNGTFITALLGPFAGTNDCNQIHLKLDRKDSSHLLISYNVKTTLGGGYNLNYEYIISGVDFTSAISIDLQVTTHNTTLTCNKFFAEYKPI